MLGHLDVLEARQENWTRDFIYELVKIYANQN
jgi:hypothetical protein